MAKKPKDGEVNRSEAIREIFKKNPEVTVKEVVSTLAGKGSKVTPNLVYLVKGKIKGEKTRRQTVNRNAVQVAAASGSTFAVDTIRKVKGLAKEVGGLEVLKALVDALSE